MIYDEHCLREIDGDNRALKVIPLWRRPRLMLARDRQGSHNNDHQESR